MLKEILIFLGGAGIGGAAVYFTQKSVFREKADREIASVKAEFHKAQEEMKKPEKTEEKTEPATISYEDYNAYNKILDDMKTSVKQRIEREAAASAQKDYPYTVAAHEVQNDKSHAYQQLYYFEDGIVTDDEYTPMNDVSEVIGDDNLEKFGEYDDDSTIYVRNDALGVDYCIIKKYESYEEVVKGQ